MMSAVTTVDFFHDDSLSIRKQKRTEGGALYWNVLLWFRVELSFSCVGWIELVGKIAIIIWYSIFILQDVYLAEKPGNLFSPGIL